MGAFLPIHELHVRLTHSPHAMSQPATLHPSLYNIVAMGAEYNSYIQPVKKTEVTFYFHIETWTVRTVTRRSGAGYRAKTKSGDDTLQGMLLKQRVCQ